ncbi:MAG: TatD family hydrolase [Actinobacteria bacterium]|nr:TatD family hydrolase [Actinomycetota bacterium]
MWFDSHCHLHICEQEAPLADLIGRAEAAGVHALVTLGTDVASSRRAVAIAHEHGVHAGVGVHPNDADTWSEDAAVGIEAVLRDDRVVAVGETGLDLYRDEVPVDLQRTAFSAHVDMSKRHGKALVIHTRNSVLEVLDMLLSEGAPERLVFHCWSGDEAALRRALTLGAYISFAGNVSFRSAGDLRAAAGLVPRDRLLIETDSPYLAPEPRRGRSNEPANVVHVGSAVADALGVDPEEIAAATAANAASLFGLLGMG